MRRTFLFFNARILISIFAIIVSAHLSGAVFARDGFRLRVGIAGFVGSECGPEHDVQIAGSRCEIVVTIIPKSDNNDRNWRPTGPLEGLTFTTGLRSMQPDEKRALWRLDPDNFQEMPELINRLHPEFYISRHQTLLFSVPHVKRPDDPFRRPQYRYLITIPEDLAGQMLCITCVLDNPTYGHLEASDCVRIVAPCSINDVNQAKGTHVRFAYNSGDSRRALELADSLFQTGWQWWPGFESAKYAAHDLELYDRELEYLDLMYTIYERASWLGPKNPEADERIYCMMRDDIIERINQQQQDTLQVQSRE